MRLHIEERPAPFTSRHMRVCALYGDHTQRAIGHGETADEARAKCIEDARKLHAALGTWLAGQDAKGGE